MGTSRQRVGPRRATAWRCVERCAAAIVAVALQGSTWIAPPPDVALIGKERSVIAAAGESLSDIALRERLGQDALHRANPTLPRSLAIAGETVRLPTRHVLPAAPREGLVINLPERALYDFTGVDVRGRPTLAVYPVSIGRTDWPTPLGETHIVGRRYRPTWTPPASIHAEARERGLQLPSVVPAGPDNPLGLHALYLGWPGFLLHGTNAPGAIGQRVTHGCVRLYPDHVARLFARVPDGTPVRFVDEPVKVGWFAGRLYLEVHEPTDDRLWTGDALLDDALRLIALTLEDRPDVRADAVRIRRAVNRRDGLPVDVSKAPRATALGDR